MGDIFREVDEELKQERYEKLWRQYGKYAIAAVVLLVAGVAGWKAWESHQISERQAEGAQFQAAAALMQEGKTAEAANAFAAIGAASGSGYGLLSRFYQASLSAQAGDAVAAIQVYDSIAADTGTPPSMRSLATVLAGLQALSVSTVTADAIEAKIAPLSAAGNPYRHVALEILALTAQRSGNTEKAVEQYRSIVDDAEAPAGIRTRASQMLNILGGS